MADPPGEFELTAQAYCTGELPGVHLEWSTSTEATSYEIIRDGTKVETVEADSTTFTDTIGLAVSVEYTYVIRAKKGARTANSNTVTVMTLPSCFTAPVQVDGYYGSTFALMSDGTVRAWGNNNLMALGDGTQTNRAQPVTVKNLTGVTEIAAGGGFTFALLTDGTVVTWGKKIGNHGTNTLAYSTPTLVQNTANIVSIAAGANHGMALTASGNVLAWGNNHGGAVGIGEISETQMEMPVDARLVHNISGVASISAGQSHSLAVTTSGALWTWGMNENGELGYDTGKKKQTTPRLVTGIPSIAQAAGGYLHSVALAEDGTVWHWGRLFTTNPPNGSETINQSVPVQVPNLTDIVAISAGTSYSLALGADGTLWAWGDNGGGQFGTGTTPGSLNPVPIATNLTAAIESFASPGGYSVLLDADGVVWTAGRNGDGQLGDGTLLDRPTYDWVRGL